MKKAFILVLKYFIFLIIGFAAGFLLYTCYLSVLNSVAGIKLRFLPWSQLIKPFFYFAGCLLIVICPLVSYTRIKNKGGILQIIFYILLCLLTWGLFMPGVIHFGTKYGFTTLAISSPDSLSGNYFRKEGDKVFYFTKDLDNNPSMNNETPAVTIDTTQEGKVEVENLNDTKIFQFYNHSYPYRDLLVRDAFAAKKSSINFIDFRFYLTKAANAFNRGWTFYLAYLSFAFALCSVFVFSNISGWRLLNSSCIFCSTLLIMMFNALYYLPYFDHFKAKYITYNAFFKNLSWYMYDPPLVLVNLIYGVVLIAVGIIHICVVKNKKD